MAIDPCQLYRRPKSLVFPTKWVQTDSQYFNMNAALSIEGAIVEGLELRGGATQTVPDRAVRFQIQHHASNSPCVPLGRAEWRPFGSHTNPKAGPSELQFAVIEGSHVHCFELNWLNGEGRMRAGNLPIARPMTADPASFKEFMEVVGKEFNIEGIERIEPPPWRIGDLFRV